MSVETDAVPGPVADDHRARRDAHAATAAALDARTRAMGVGNVVLFVGAALLLMAGWLERQPLLLGGALVAAIAFAISFALTLRVEGRRDRALVRRDIHERQLSRMALRLEGLDGGDDLAPTSHPYASDLDLFGGKRSLFARIATAHTAHGRSLLASWLLAPADAETVAARAEAVREIAPERALREALEAAVLETGKTALDGRPFLEFVRRHRVLLGNPALVTAIRILPLVTIGVFFVSGSMLPRGAWVPLLVAQFVLLARFEKHVGPAHQLLVSRARFVESYRTLMEVVEGTTLRAPLLVAQREALSSSGVRASVELRSLETWASLFELRQQGLFHLFVNVWTLWDLQVLVELERWAARGERACAAWFEAIGIVEAIASLSVLLDQDSDASMPEVRAHGEGPDFVAKSVAHPLLAPEVRVANDVSLPGPEHALVITGSNMAGKSTLLRAIGVNMVLALAGGPVVASSFRTIVVRVRASMRIADSLAESSSYFHAELARLRVVVENAEAEPPIFFLLDELLRGTNARARHLGARAVLLHLLERRALGLVATHDIALSELEEELSGRVVNVHFTDVMEGGEMRFDYRLRDGVVKTSNALLLLQMAGIAIEPNTSLTALR